MRSTRTILRSTCTSTRRALRARGASRSFEENSRALHSERHIGFVANRFYRAIPDLDNPAARITDPTRHRNLNRAIYQNDPAVYLHLNAKSSQRSRSLKRTPRALHSERHLGFVAKILDRAIHDRAAKTLLRTRNRKFENLTLRSSLVRSCGLNPLWRITTGHGGKAGCGSPVHPGRTDGSGRIGDSSGPGTGRPAREIL